jgi:hypothetical protein
MALKNWEIIYKHDQTNALGSKIEKKMLRGNNAGEIPRNIGFFHNHVSTAIGKW